MSGDGQESQPRGSMDFVETSILDTIIPSSPTMNIKEALRGSVERLDEGIASPLASIAQRQILFFGKSPATSNGSMSYLFIDPR
jgi:hypothetical protein